MESMEDILQQHEQSLKKEEEKELAENSSLVGAFIKDAASKGVTLTSDDFKFLPKIGIVAEFPNLVNLLYPEIQKDKEGLIDVTFLNSRFKKETYADGFLYGDSCMLMAHPYFRRGYQSSSNYAPNFIGLFWTIDTPEILPFIALDYDRVRVNLDHKFYMEKDTWFGPKFNKIFGQIADGIVQLRPPEGLKNIAYRYFFGDMYSLDIGWKTIVDGTTREKIKSFYCEEFKNEEITIEKDGKIYHPVRYIHAEYVLDIDYFRHFDGAIHFYTIDEYLERRKADLNYNAKQPFQIKTISQKLFN